MFSLGAVNRGSRAAKVSARGMWHMAEGPKPAMADTKATGVKPLNRARSTCPRQAQANGVANSPCGYRASDVQLPRAHVLPYRLRELIDQPVHILLPHHARGGVARGVG